MTTEFVRAIRGATTVDTDSAEQIQERTIELIDSIMQSNGLGEDQLISMLFTATQDLTSTFPATAARLNGFGAIPLMCAQEIPVPGSTPRCIRVMIHLSTELPREALHHVYLHGAQGLRDDLPA